MTGPLGKPPTLPATPDASSEPPGGRGAPLGPAPLPRLSLGSSGRAGGHGASSIRMRRGRGGAPLGRAPRPPLAAPTKAEKLQRAQLQAAQNAAKPKTAPAAPPAKASPIPIAKAQPNDQQQRFRNRLASALARKTPAKRAQLRQQAAQASTVAQKRAEQYKGIDATMDALRRPPAPAQPHTGAATPEEGA